MPKKKRRDPKSRPAPEPGAPLLTEIDRFLEKGAQGVSRSLLRPLEEEKKVPSPPSPQQLDTSSQVIDATASAPALPPLELVLSEDGLQAIIETVHPSHSVEGVLAFLREEGIVYGVDREAIEKAIKTAQQTSQPVRHAVVAQGRRPIPPSPPRCEYSLPEGLKSMPSLEPVRRLLALQDRDELVRTAAGMQAWAARPGDSLAVKIESPGKEGIDVKGKPIPAEGLVAKAGSGLEPGEGVKLDPSSGRYLATGYGYAGLEGGKVALLFPVWVSPDELEAHYLHLSPYPGSARPRPEDLRDLLKTQGITVGLDEEQLSALCQALESGSSPGTLVTLARGQPPLPPQEPTPQFSVEFGLRPGSFRPDGSVDFKDRNLFPSVQKDQLLAELRPSAPGQPGMSVRGKEIPPPPPSAARLIAGDNTRLESSEGVQRLYATTDGGASLSVERQREADGTEITAYTIAVQQVAEIDGDIGYQTGNLDFRGNVAIKGSVTGGFSVRATGNIAVKGSIEAGAQLQAGGDLTVGQGIVGRHTRIEVKGSATARFVHDAQIQAGVDVLVSRYIHGASIRAGGRVQVEGMGGSGGIVGGQIWAIREVLTRNLGSASSTGTYLYLGIAPEQQAQYQQLSQTARQAELMLQKLLKAINLPALEAEAIRRLMARNPARKKVLVHYIKKAHQLAQIRDQQLQKQQELSQQLAQLAAQAKVEVQEQAFARTVIQIGHAELTLDQDLKRVRFSLDPQEQRVVWSEL